MVPGMRSKKQTQFMNMKISINSGIMFLPTRLSALAFSVSNVYARATPHNSSTLPTIFEHRKRGKEI